VLLDYGMSPERYQWLKGSFRHEPRGSSTGRQAVEHIWSNPGLRKRARHFHSGSTQNRWIDADRRRNFSGRSAVIRDPT
jgi:hypothetical protein